jgi:hypothetical protein
MVERKGRGEGEMGGGARETAHLGGTHGFASIRTLPMFVWCCFLSMSACFLSCIYMYIYVHKCTYMSVLTDTHTQTKHVHVLIVLCICTHASTSVHTHTQKHTHTPEM